MGNTLKFFHVEFFIVAGDLQVETKEQQKKPPKPAIWGCSEIF